MSKTSTPAIQPEASTAIVPMSTAEQAFRAAAQMRDKVLSTPFANNRSMARQGTPFTILEVLPDRFTDADPERNIPEREQICYLIELESGYMHEDPDHPENEKAFSKGDQLILALDRNRVRSKDRDVIEGLVRDHGALPHLAINQYPATKAGHSPSHGIVHMADWRTLKEAVAK